MLVIIAVLRSLDMESKTMKTWKVGKEIFSTELLTGYMLSRRIGPQHLGYTGLDELTKLFLKDVDGEYGCQVRGILRN